MITRRTFSRGLVTGAAAAGAAGLAGAPPAAAASRSRGVPRAQVRADNVVLVHGLFADGSSWSDVIRRLQRTDLRVSAVQNPLTSLEDAVAETRRVLALQVGPTVLAGHSWSGTVVSEVGADPGITGLVYVAARAPDAGEDFAALAQQYPAPPASAGIQTVDGYQQLSEEAFLRDFAGDVERDRARVLHAVQGRNTTTLTSGRTTVAAWRVRPTWYQVSTQDRTIDPGLERFLAHRMGAATIELDASHLALVSRPRAVADLILAATGR